MPEIDPELAEKVLQADLRNIIKKISDGGNATASERAMLQKAAMPAAFTSDARVMTLVRRWVAGGRLTADELAEIRVCQQLPPAEREASPPPDAKPSPTPFVMDADGPRFTGSRVKYPENLAAYAERFGTSEKTLKRWIMRGRFEDEDGNIPRSPPDLPPFHNPIALPEWCERRMGNRPPEWVLRVAHDAAKHAPPPAATPQSTPEPSQAPAAPAPSPPGTVPPRDFSDVQALDFEANVHQLRLSLAIDQRLLDEAKLGQDEALTVKRQRAYRETYDLLRKSENDLIAWKEQVGKLAPFDDVRAENTRISASIFAAVLRLVRNTRPKLAGKSEPEQDAIWQAETLKCFVALRDARFIDHESVLAA